MRKHKVQILFYTGGGNTQLVASSLKERFLKDGYDVCLYNIKKGSSIPDFSNYDINVLATPVYAYRAPGTVLKFLEEIPAGRGDFYLIFTKGLILGNAAYEVFMTLKNKGYSVVGFSDIMLADTLFLLTARKGSPLEFLYLLPNRVHTFKLNFIYKSIIKSLHTKKPVRLRSKLYSCLTNLIAKEFWRRVERWKKELFADEKCNLCGVCVKVCPRGNIKVVEGKVIFGDDCEFCTACIHRCPVEAVQVNRKTQNKARFKIGKEARYFR
ncbi:MAG: EFR1 family ferrodoxin [candidate division WOR-3 bacterium]